VRDKFYKLHGFDTETVYTVVHKLYSVQYYNETDGGHILYDKREIKRWADSLHNAVLVAHNAVFDFAVTRHLWPDAKVFVNRGKPYKIVLKPDVFLVDLARFFSGMSLARVGEAFGYKKLEKPPYLGKREPTPSERQYFEEYAINDAKITYFVFKYIMRDLVTRDIEGNYGVTRVFNTAPSYARYRWSTTTDVKVGKWYYDLENLYLGARTECIGYGKFDDVVVFDINSSYPHSAWRLVFPDTEKYVISNDISYEGAVYAEVLVKKDWLPPLAYKKEVNGEMKLIFPYGKLKKWFTTLELRYLQDNKMGEVHRIIKHRLFEGVDSPFRKFVEEHYNMKLRAEAEHNEAMRMYAKLMLNSFYGTWGLRIQSGQVRTTPPDDWNGWVEENGIWIKRSTDKPKLAPQSNLLVASYITADARLYLHSLCKDDETVVYMDTDSIHTMYPERYMKHVGSGLGKLKIEDDKSGENYYFRAKTYIIESEDEKQFYIKGLPRREIIFSPDTLSVTGMGITIRQNLFHPDLLLTENSLVRVVKLEFDHKRLLKDKIDPFHSNTMSEPRCVEDW